MNPATLYPWQQAEWARLAPALTGARLGHALLLTGPPGIGKRHLAGVLARALLCFSPEGDGRPCGACRACTQMDAGSHPDCASLVPESPGKKILIDPARQFVRSLFLTAQTQRGRVGFIDPGDQLTPQAANSLLKALEEPPPGCHILLVSDRPDLLLATIRSRCQQWRLARPDPAALVDWLAQMPAVTADALALARNAPLRALALADSPLLARQEEMFSALESLASPGGCDPVTIAKQWREADPPRVLDWLTLVAADLLKLGTGAPENALVFAARGPQLGRMANSLSLSRLRLLIPELAGARRLLETSVDTQLVLEALAIDLLACRREQDAR